MSKARRRASVAQVNGVKIVGYTNVAGRLAASASGLYAKNLYNFLDILVDKKTKALAVNWDDEIVKATALTRDGAVVHPNFQPKTRGLSEPGLQHGHRSVRNEAADRAQAAAEVARQAAEAAQQYADAAAAMLAATAHAATGATIDPFVFRFSIFILAVFVGYYVVWSVTPALHTPLMSVTNAISSVIVVGALLAVSVELVKNDFGPIWARLLGFFALILASVNIFGGFLVTQRMLAMYEEEEVRGSAMSPNTAATALSGRRRPVHPGAARAVEPGDQPAGQFLRHDRHGDRDRRDARVASAGKLLLLAAGRSSASASAAARAR